MMISNVDVSGQGKPGCFRVSALPVSSAAQPLDLLGCGELSFQQLMICSESQHRGEQSTVQVESEDIHKSSSESLSEWVAETVVQPSNVPTDVSSIEGQLVSINNDANTSQVTPYQPVVDRSGSDHHSNLRLGRGVLPLPEIAQTTLAPIENSTVSHQAKSPSVSSLPGLEISIHEHSPASLMKVNDAPSGNTFTPSLPAVFLAAETFSLNKVHPRSRTLHALQDSIQLMVEQKVHEAKIRLDPPEMGKVEISIRLEGDKMTIHLNAGQTATREALQSLSDRLRADVAQSIQSQVEVSVGDGDTGRGQKQHTEMPTALYAFENITDEASDPSDSSALHNVLAKA